MLKTGSVTEFNTAKSWHSRSEYWQAYRPTVIGRPKKFAYHEPLILCCHGVSVRVDHGTLFIRDGFTHYPQKADEVRLFPGDPNLPDRIVMVDGHGGISFAALNWMSEQQIAFVQLDWRGRISSIGGIVGYSANQKLTKAQAAICDTRRSLEISRWLIREKLSNSIATLLAVVPKSDNRKVAITKIRKWCTDLRNKKKLNSISRTYGVEGGAAAAYFHAWHGVALHWLGLNRKPIPNSWLLIGARTMTWRKSGQNARHPINAMLNYGYAILIGQIRTEVIAIGLDPTIGVMHGASQNRIPLVYDLMEPLRPLVDRSVLAFALSNTLNPSGFANVERSSLL